MPRWNAAPACPRSSARRNAASAPSEVPAVPQLDAQLEGGVRHRRARPRPSQPSRPRGSASSRPEAVHSLGMTLLVSAPECGLGADQIPALGEPQTQPIGVLGDARSGLRLRGHDIALPANRADDSRARVRLVPITGGRADLGQAQPSQPTAFMASRTTSTRSPPDKCRGRPSERLMSSPSRARS